VVYDSYWDPVSSHATESEAQTIAKASGSHVIFDPQGTPGQLREGNYGHWDAFMATFDEPDASE
jgi:hypothetical protein